MMILHSSFNMKRSGRQKPDLISYSRLEQTRKAKLTFAALRSMRIARRFSLIVYY